jgi:hypothetical protein
MKTSPQMKDLADQISKGPVRMFLHPLDAPNLTAVPPLLPTPARQPARGQRTQTGRQAATTNRQPSESPAFRQLSFQQTKPLRLIDLMMEEMKTTQETPLSRMLRTSLPHMQALAVIPMPQKPEAH